jgi:hypothetical protein
MTSVQIYIEGQRLELFKDENIKINLSLQNIADISKQYADFTQSFSVPASPTNNAIFEHFYQNEVDSTFDYNTKRDAYIEIDYTPFRSGKIQLNKATLKDTQASSYSITFYGKLTNLIDIIRDFKLKDLDFNQYSHEYNGDEVEDRITNDVTDYDIRYPLISGRRLWSYNDGTTTDIKTTASALSYTELFPAIKVDNILSMITTQFNIDFTGLWRLDQRWLDCFLLLKKEKEFIYWTKALKLVYTNFSRDLTTNTVFDVLSAVSSRVAYIKDFYNNSDRYYNNINSVFTLISDFPENYLNFNESVSHEILIRIAGLNSTTKWIIEVYEDNILINTFNGIGNTPGLFYLVLYTRNFFQYGNQIIDEPAKEINFKIKLSEADNFVTEIKSRYDVIVYGPLAIYASTLSAETIMQGSHSAVDDTFDFLNFIPDMTIKDFLAGVMKQFNLVFDPQSEQETNDSNLVLRIEPLDMWYQRGAVIDITDYVDIKDIELQVSKLYKSIEFKYQQSQSFLNIEYRETNNIDYGDLKYIYPYDGEEYKVELPFENLLQTTFTGTDLQVGYLLDKDFNPYENKPILLYKYDLQSCDFKFDKGPSTVTVSDYIPFGQDLKYNGNDLTLHFNAENSTLLLEPIFGTSFFNYYQGYLESLFDNKQRIVNIKANLPISLVQNLKLNDRLIINDKRFIINNIGLELTSGVCDLELLYDLR